jgi:hypothetical protein
MNEDFATIGDYFHAQRMKAVKDFVDSRRALRGDKDALRRLLLAVDIDVTDEQAAVATQLSELIDE